MAVAEYRIRRSQRARRVRVTVDPDGSVTVTLPRRAPERAAAEAVEELAPWIARRRRTFARAAAEVARVPGTVPYSARRWPWSPSRAGREIRTRWCSSWISPMTARRDLDELERRGAARRTAPAARCCRRSQHRRTRSPNGSASPPTRRSGSPTPRSRLLPGRRDGLPGLIVDRVLPRSPHRRGRAPAPRADQQRTGAAGPRRVRRTARGSSTRSAGCFAGSPAPTSGRPRCE